MYLLVWLVSIHLFIVGMTFIMNWGIYFSRRSSLTNALSVEFFLISYLTCRQARSSKNEVYKSVKCLFSNKLQILNITVINIFTLIYNFFVGLCFCHICEYGFRFSFYNFLFFLSVFLRTEMYKIWNYGIHTFLRVCWAQWHGIRCHRKKRRLWIRWSDSVKCHISKPRR